ncbi:hypothetical protein [Plantactinospora endophytica]|uniref:DUF3592 domain-containing protein n=1 Tax=Plantactinospora endophytica TaxID=673535 RepID=A0ABQ4DT23_9ACTN|nr:hypothetical protein [Plantactinospora endophytica]GIG85599.1 hypothetical protein Pen02_05350 [Plantactinospora endophytica]
MIAFCLSAAPLLLIAGLTIGPPPTPVGVPLDGTVVSHTPTRTGNGTEAVIAVRGAPDGQLLCGIERILFPDRRLPLVGAPITVYYADGMCSPEPADNTGLRVGLVLFGGTGVVGVTVYFWQRSGPGRRFRAARAAARWRRNRRPRTPRPPRPVK